jgi:hypothetical protein
VTPYKPGPQACFLIDKMAGSEKSIQEVLTKLVAHLDSIERKVDLTTVDLGKVHEKVDLTMSSLSVIQEEQVQVHKQLQTMLVAKGTSHDDNIMGATPTSTSMTSSAMSSTPLPIPSDWLLRHPQVTLNNPPPHAQIPEGIHGDGDQSDSRHPWLPKMEFPHFDHTDSHIWLDKCSSYFAMYQTPPSFRYLHHLGFQLHRYTCWVL